MANITDSTINFNNVKEGAGVGLTFGGFPVRIDGLTPDLIAEYGGIINAVQIDWNAANLGNYVNIDANGGKSNGNSVEINTTGALLSYISALAQRIDDLAIAI